jgi:hypothetical protein
MEPRISMRRSTSPLPYHSLTIGHISRTEDYDTPTIHFDTFTYIHSTIMYCTASRRLTSHAPSRCREGGVLDRGLSHVTGHDTRWRTHVAYRISRVSHALTPFSSFSDNRTEG